MSHEVFISYAHANKTVADAVCATLETAGIRCWIAPRDVRPGAEWTGAIMKAISMSRVVVLVFSSHANQSAQVGREVHAAFEHGIVVIPMRVEEVVPSGSLDYYLGSVHWLDAMTPPLQQHLNQLAETIRALLASKEHEVAALRRTSETAEEPRTASSRTRVPRWATWTTIGILALAGAGALYYSHLPWDRATLSSGAVLQPVLVTSGATINSSPQFSPDGTRIAFQSDRSRSLQIWTCSADGSNLIQLTNFRDALVGSPRWSADGAHIAFDVRMNGPADIWLAPAAGGNPTRLTSDPAEEVRPSWSRNGHWIYFGSTTTENRWEIWKVPSLGGPPRQVTRGGGREAFEAPDGKSIYYTRSETDGIWHLPLDGTGPPVQVSTHGRQVLWSVTSSGLVILLPTNGANREIEFIPFSNGARPKVMKLQFPPAESLRLSGSNTIAIREMSASANADAVVFSVGNEERSVILRASLKGISPD
jgi:Tol biopolymer transport system component